MFYSGIKTQDVLILRLPNIDMEGREGGSSLIGIYQDKACALIIVQVKIELADAPEVSYSEVAATPSPLTVDNN